MIVHGAWYMPSNWLMLLVRYMVGCPKLRLRQPNRYWFMVQMQCIKWAHVNGDKFAVYKGSYKTPCTALTGKRIPTVLGCVDWVDCERVATGWFGHSAGDYSCRLGVQTYEVSVCQELMMFSMNVVQPCKIFFRLQICSRSKKRKYQSSASLTFVRGIHRWPVIPRTNAQ